MHADVTQPEALVAAAQSGDLAAVDALLQRHRGDLVRYGRTVCRTDEDTEDAVQKTLWAAVRSLGALRQAGALRRWLFTIVHRFCLRPFSREEAAGDLIDGRPDDGPLADELVEANWQRARLERAVERLPALYRDVFLLRDVEGVAAPEAAARLGISVPALKSRLHRAREQLREALA
jgi:RNA polymerase sigma factor (sigma-70 family)